MRIAGKKVDAEKNINVHYPYTNEVIGTVPAGNCRACESKLLTLRLIINQNLTRYERQQILQKTAEELVRRKEEISDVITL